MRSENKNHSMSAIFLWFHQGGEVMKVLYRSSNSLGRLFCACVHWVSACAVSTGVFRTVNSFFFVSQTLFWSIRFRLLDFAFISGHFFFESNEYRIFIELDFARRTRRREKRENLTAHSNYNELWLSSEKARASRRIHFTRRAEHKMPFNNLPWLSDKRNVWTSELIFDFKIFQSFSPSTIRLVSPAKLRRGGKWLEQFLGSRCLSAFRRQKNEKRVRTTTERKISLKYLFGRLWHFEINLSHA